MHARFRPRFIPIWKSAPLLRILLPIMPGIVLQWYVQPGLGLLVGCSAVVLLTTIAVAVSKLKATQWMGIAAYSLLFVVGCWLAYVKDQRHWKDHIAHHYKEDQTVLATLQEPLEEKAKSFKADATVELLDSAGNLLPVSGKLTLYIRKDSTANLSQLGYGSQIILHQPLQPIKNAGNPGGFDFQRYAAFNGIYYQLVIAPKSIRYIGQAETNPVQRLLFNTRQWVLNQFRQYIPGKLESGLAEALLVGYKADLDKDLVEIYAGTGLAHVIAISGMHLGLIYGLLFLVTRPLRKSRSGNLASALLIIAALWLFSLLTGGAPSITRSAIMFTVIIIGNGFFKKTSIYNTLAASAIILLLYNPFYLWDVGFQLSYAALLSIAVFGEPVKNWFYSKNKLLQLLWELIAVTLSAQVLTLPLVLYHFHQFPVYFLLANMVAVPLSSIILYGLLLLLLLFWCKPVAIALGWLLHYLIFGMNSFIGWIEQLPGSRIDNLFFTIPQALVMCLLIAALAWWLLRKDVAGLATASCLLFIFTCQRVWQQLGVIQQRKLIVYNISGKTALDIVEGDRFSFMGDTVLYKKDFLQNFHLLPSRIMHQVSFSRNLPQDTTGYTRLQLGSKSLLIIDKPLDVHQSLPDSADVVLLTNRVRTKPAKLLPLLRCQQLVMDANNSRWQLAQWKNAADSLHLRLHSVQEQGAFILNF